MSCLLCCCKSDAEYDDEKHHDPRQTKERREHQSKHWETGMATAICHNPVVCIVGCLPINCCILNACNRHKALSKFDDSYSCFQDTICDPICNCCCPCDSCCLKKCVPGLGDLLCCLRCCPQWISTCAEAFLCFCCSAQATRLYVQDKLHIKTDPCDNCILCCNNACQCIKCISQCLCSIFGEDHTACLFNAIIEIIADAFFMSVIACVNTQVYVELHHHGKSSD